MDNQRLLIWALFAFLAWITYQTWVQDYAPKPQAPAAEQPAEVLDAGDAVAIDEDLPAISDSGAPDALPSTPDIAGEPVADTRAPTITVSTDVLELVISTEGGTLQAATLKKYPVAKDTPDILVQLLGTEGKSFGRIESGVRAAGGAAEATHLATFAAMRSSYDLGDDMERPERRHRRKAVSLYTRKLRNRARASCHERLRRALAWCRVCAHQATFG